MFCSVRFLFSCSGVPIDSVWFSNLKENEKVEVEFSSAGCFHHETGFFEFTGTQNNKVEVALFESLWPKEPDKPIWERSKGEKSGELELTPAELKQLDRLIGLYQDKPKGWCTTKLKLLREGKVVREKAYEDASCAILFDREMTFEFLKQRIEENNK